MMTTGTMIRSRKGGDEWSEKHGLGCGLGCFIRVILGECVYECLLCVSGGATPGSLYQGSEVAQRQVHTGFVGTPALEMQSGTGLRARKYEN
jgi:hypothetical protein